MAITPQQVDFTELLFPGRTVLYVAEVASRLKVTEQHVCDLIEEGQLHAINLGGGTRNFWRIPVKAYEDFLQKRSSLSAG
jgi:excisionase family DNA binding protein